jgi:hypothetical protein
MHPHYVAAFQMIQRSEKGLNASHLARELGISFGEADALEADLLAHGDVRRAENGRLIVATRIAPMNAERTDLEAITRAYDASILDLEAAFTARDAAARALTLAESHLSEQAARHAAALAAYDAAAPRYAKCPRCAHVPAARVCPACGWHR